jgi:hypothetical protein
MSYDRFVTLRLKSIDQGKVEINWEEGAGSYPPYALVTDWLKEAIDKTRGALHALKDAYPRHVEDDDRLLAELARCGHELRNALFDECDADDWAKAEEARSWFEALPTVGVTISVKTDAKLAIPWGALHEHGDKAGIGQIYSGFWASCFQVTATYNSMRVPPSGKATQPAVLLAGKNEQIFAETLEKFTPDQRTSIEGQLARRLGCANTVTGYKELWTRVGTDDCIVYFFGHATDNELLFNDQDDGRLSVRAFSSAFRRNSRTEGGRASTTKVLTVLNGCLSCTGEDANSFMMATTLPGFYGFIGAEAPIPNVLGLRFGHELLESLLDDGLTVGDAMKKLRERHRPYGLLYGCYAHPQLSVSTREG